MNWPKGKCPSSASELENILGKSAKEQRRHELSILFVYLVFETFRCHVSRCIQLKYLGREARALKQVCKCSSRFFHAKLH